MTLTARNIPRSKRERMARMFEKAVIAHGGNNWQHLYNNRSDPDLKYDWDILVMKAKMDLRGHFTAEEITKVEFTLCK